MISYAQIQALRGLLLPLLNDSKPLRWPVHVHDKDQHHGRWCSVARVRNCVIWLRHSSLSDARAHVNYMRARGFQACVRRWKAPHKRPLAQRGRA